MKTVVIAMPDINSISNFEHLPKQFVVALNHETKVRVIIIHETNDRIWDNQIVKSYDLLIASDLTVLRTVLKQRDDIILLPRPSKSEMAVLIEQAGSKYPHFRGIRTYALTHHNTVSQRGYCNLPSNVSYVLKPNHGARGIGQVVFPANSLDIPEFFRELSQPGFNSEKLIEKLPQLLFNTQGETSIGEGLAMIRDQGAHLQERITNIDAEFRLLVNYNKVLCCTREITAGNYPQPVSIKIEKNMKVASFYIDKGTFDGVQPIDGLNQKIADEIAKFILDLGLKFASMDIFTTKDGKWGCFEFSNQYSTDDHLPEDMCQWHKQYIINVLREKATLLGLES